MPGLADKLTTDAEIEGLELDDVEIATSSRGSLGSPFLYITPSPLP